MTKVKGRTTHMQFRLTPDLKARIRKAAQAEGISMSQWLERLTERSLARIEKTGRTDER